MLIRLLLCLLLLPTLAHATTDWDEGFEYSGGTIQTMYNNMVLTGGGPWDSSCGVNYQVIAPTTQALAQSGAPAPHGGTRMLEERFRGHDGVTPGYQSCYIDRLLTAPTTGTLYTRFFMYIPSSFQVDATSTKVTLHPTYAGNAHTTAWWKMVGSPTLAVELQRNYVPAGFTDPSQNFYGGSIPQNQWACVETRITYATLGQANGVIQAWVNEVQTMNFTNVIMDQAGQQSVFSGVRLYTQNGVGNLYYDDYAVSRNARIGCTTAPPPPSDTIAPSVPTGIAASATVPLQNNISWTASTDNVGVQDYTVSYCTGAACTPSLTAGTTTSTGLAHTGLTGGTVYGYRVSARDAAGNISGNSSIVYATALSAGGATSLTINSSGKFVLNGTQTFLLGISYFDALSYRTADIDAIAANGFNNIRIFANWRPELGSTESVCDSAGAIIAGRATTINALIDYAEALGISVSIVVLSENSPSLMVNDAARLACVTSTVNAFKAQPLVMFDVVQEYNVAAITWADTLPELKTYTDQARTACSTCIIFASGTSDLAGSTTIAPHDTTAALDSIMRSNISTKMGTNGESLLAVHDYRSSNWYSISGARATTYLNYLASIGRASAPVIFDEPCRDNGYSAECDATTASQFIQAAVDSKAAGLAGYTWHTQAAFDLGTSAMTAQFTVKEATVFAGIASALATATNEVPTLVETCTFSGAFTDCMYAGIETNETPVIVSGQLQAASTSNQSVGVYDGQGATIPPINQGMTIEQTVTRSASPLYLRVGVRMQAGTDYSGYDCRFTINPSAPDSVELVRKDNDNPVTVAGPISVTLDLTKRHGCWAYGSTFWATEGDSVSTQTTLLGATDTTYSTGLPYLYLTTFGPATTALKVDNARVYGFAAPAPPCTPSLTQVVANSTGAVVTSDAACPPTKIRVNTELTTEDLAIALFPSGVYTRSGGWKLGENFVQMLPIDSQGVVGTDPQSDSVSEFVPNPDVTAPVMTFTGPTGELPNGTTSAVTSFTTDEAAACRWATTNIAYTAMTNLANDFGLSHSFNATSLSTGANTFYAQCQDQAPQPNTTSTALTITLTVAASTADTTAPSTVTNLVATAVSASQLSITHDLSTDAGGSPSYAAYISQDGSTYGLALAYTGVPQTISGLSPGTLYYIKVLAIDPSLNPAVAYSNVASATTTAIPDTTPPSDPVGLTVGAITKNSADITWTPGSDNSGTVNTAVEICSGSAACTAFSLVGTGSGTLFRIGPPLITLTPSTIYRVRIKHVDKVGLVSANYSERVTFTTAANTTSALVIPRQPVSFSQPRAARTP